METSSDVNKLCTRGIKANRREHFSVKFSGQQVYDMLNMLESKASNSTNYLEIRQAVAFAEIIREQVTEQGF